jgi:hypothetical protein
MTNQKPDPKSAPVVTYSRRAGGSWIQTTKAKTPLGTVEEVTLSTTPPPGARRTP